MNPTVYSIILCSLAVLVLTQDLVDDSSNMALEKRYRQFAFAKRARSFAFAKRYPGRAFAFAKRSSPNGEAELEADDMDMDKRALNRFAFAKRARSFAFAKRARSFAFA